jgi:hypothetical protein
LPYTFEFDSLDRVLQGRFGGQVTDEELTEYCRDCTESIALIDPRAVVTDLLDVASFKVSPQTILKLAEVRPAAPEQDPVRIIIAASPHVFGMARMFELAGQDAHPRVSVVRAREAAWEILGVTNPQFKPFKNQSGKVDGK